MFLVPRDDLEQIDQDEFEEEFMQGSDGTFKLFSKNENCKNNHKTAWILT